MGINIVLNEIKLEEKIKNVDLVITGEGKLDYQTTMRKAPIGVAKLAKKYNKKVIGICGSLYESSKQCNKEGIDAYFSIINIYLTLEEALKKEIDVNNLMITV